MKNKTIILGAGVTGLSAGYASGLTVYEGANFAGGLCSSYYLYPGSTQRWYHQIKKDECYRFEIGGGHWIFGADATILEYINRFCVTKQYIRNSAVYFPDMDLYVPFPLQNHLSFLPQEIAKKALAEIINSDCSKTVLTMRDWLEIYFGKTLCEIFFFPFHELYTAGLYTKIAPQDAFKSPLDKNQVIMGAEGKTSSAGYNVTFIYPENGMDEFIRNLASQVNIIFNAKVIKIDIVKKEIFFDNKSSIGYEKIISTLPLNKILDIIEPKIDIENSPPYTSVLVINIAAQRGVKSPNQHWIYIPKSKAGFHRVGCYSNVNDSFLPRAAQKEEISLYVEKAYLGGNKPSPQEIDELCANTISELQSWGFIREPKIIDPTWIDVAYTWSFPNSRWSEQAINILKENSIYQTGRYGKWKFQGIADSIKDGLSIAKDLSL